MREPTRLFVGRLSGQLATGRSPAAAARAAGAAGVQVSRPVDPYLVARRLLAAAHRARGFGPAAIGRSMGIDRRLAWEWVRLGRRAWQADPEGSLQLLVDTLGPAVTEVALAGVDLAQLTGPVT